MIQLDRWQLRAHQPAFRNKWMLSGIHSTFHGPRSHRASLRRRL